MKVFEQLGVSFNTTIRPRILSSRPHNGFTMIELLVVLVIVGITTSLLITGLTTTWSSFDRLSQKNLTQSRGQIPKSWFLKSVNAALLGHPEKSMFSGTQEQFTFTSFMSPDDDLERPRRITWLLSENEGVHSLSFSFVDIDRDGNTQSKGVTVWKFGNRPNVSFEYLVDGNWVNAYTPQSGNLPNAIRVNQISDIWVVAAIKRPLVADMPPKMPMLGKYEF